jgi:hypothetical protein
MSDAQHDDADRSEVDAALDPDADADPADEADWVEVRRFDDAIGATMIRDFLQDHGVRVALRGNPLATRMTWSQTSDNLRIVVAPADLERAREALAAMSTGGDTHPFRGASPPADDEPEPAAAFVKPRSGLGGAILALFMPIGAGHFYARHGAAGTVLGAGMVGAGLAGALLRQPFLYRAWALLWLVDIFGTFAAVRRFNAQRVPSESRQRRVAAGVVVLALLFVWLTAWVR